MVILSTILSGLLGAFTAGIPKAFELFEKKQTFAQEMKVREFEAASRREDYEQQVKLATTAAMAKVEESYYEATASENKAFHEGIAAHLEAISKPTGYAAIDALNAMVRPLTAYLLLTMLAVGLVSWMFGLMAINDAFGAQLGVLFTTAFEFVFGFYFGARAVSRPGATLSLK